MSDDKKEAWAQDASWGSARRRGKGKLAEGSKAVEADRQATIEKAVETAVEEARPGLHKIPDPVEPAGEGALTDEERTRYEECLEGVDLGNTAWFIQGKALDTIATGKLFRDTPHKLEPERTYRTIEEWAPLEKGISVGKCSKLRAGWAIGEVLAARSYDVNPGQVREIVPVKNAFNLNAAVAVYVLVADSWGPDQVTAERLRNTVKMLPGDLKLDEDEDVDALAKTIKGVLVEEIQPPVSRAIPPAVTRAVDRTAIKIADALNRPRISRSEVTLRLMEAFADPEDTTVYDAVLERMQEAEKATRKAAREALK
ncbi:hypothetical protein SAMN05216483_6707 [Streptomyces sp. 2131.1]|uniref:hypothetical protein n=1 Tax=Streptomyces sp. 2131.1 TaxID=1855346 RepID=UPI0008949E5D|nr:hypothetical protein [Streptomyces sp. 2131.1]SEE83400.1 hypothetical protein SAMN05216483_6707 [Streptomyces sp. 2131.1]